MPEVVALRWPEEREDAARLMAEGVPILYLVDGDAEPPAPAGCLEDWVRMPGDERDLKARLAALELRAAHHDAPPFVDDADRLHHEGRVVALTRIEAGLARALIARRGSSVPDDALRDAAMRSGADDDVRLRVELGHLRARLRPVHLVVRRAHGGYALVASS